MHKFKDSEQLVGLLRSWIQGYRQLSDLLIRECFIDKIFVVGVGQ